MCASRSHPLNRGQKTPHNPQSRNRIGTTHLGGWGGRRAWRRGTCGGVGVESDTRPEVPHSVEEGRPRSEGRAGFKSNQIKSVRGIDRAAFRELKAGCGASPGPGAPRDGGGGQRAGRTWWRS